MKFELGPGVKCDLAALIDTRLLVQANSGGGKSWCLRRLLEQTHGHVQQLIIDPEGEFASLREKFDYVWAAKAGGDTAADPRSAKLLAERLLELGVSAVLDIYELKAHERIKFVRGFLEAMVDAPKKLWHPALVIVDEAHVYCPQKGEAESAGAVIDLCTRGRKRGYCAVLATQRLSKLHKDAAAELNNKLIGRTGLDVDIARAADELGFTGKDQQRGLRELTPGHFFAFGPALGAGITKVAIGPVQTSHPKAGARIAFTPPPPTDKVRALLPKLADLPAEAEQKQKSHDDLKRENADLRRKLTAAERQMPVKLEPRTETKVERVVVPMLTEQHLGDLKGAAAAIQATFAGARDLVEKMVEARGGLTDALTQIDRAIAQATKPSQTPATPVPSRTVARALPPPRAARAKQEQRPDLSGDALTGPEQRILDAIAWLEQLGIDEPEQTAVAFLAGYTYGGGAFNNPRGRLNTRALVEYRPGDRIRLTDDGRALANAPDSVLTTSELHDRVLNRLPGPERKLMTALLAEYPRELPDEELAELSGYTPGAGAFNNPKGRLRSLGLIEYPKPRHSRARDLLFLESA